MERPVGVTVVAVAMMSFSLLLVGITGLGVLITLFSQPGNVFLALPVTIFYLLVFAIPGVVGYGCGTWKTRPASAACFC